MSNIRFSPKRLEYLADADLVWPKDIKHYTSLLKAAIKAKGWDYNRLEEGDMTDDVVSEHLWWDCCALINELAQALIDEQSKTSEIIVELKNALKEVQLQLTKISKK